MSPDGLRLSSRRPTHRLCMPETSSTHIAVGVRSRIAVNDRERAARPVRTLSHLELVLTSPRHHRRHSLPLRPRDTVEDERSTILRVHSDVRERRADASAGTGRAGIRTRTINFTAQGHPVLFVECVHPGRPREADHGDRQQNEHTQGRPRPRAGSAQRRGLGRAAFTTLFMQSLHQRSIDLNGHARKYPSSSRRYAISTKCSSKVQACLPR